MIEKTAILLLSFLVSSTLSQAEQRLDAQPLPPSYFMTHLDVRANRSTPRLEIYKLRNGKTITIQENQQVMVYAFDPIEYMKIQSAQMIEIRGHAITFKPYSEQSREITYADSTLDFVAITTFGSIVRGILINTFFVSAIVIVVTAILISACIVAIEGKSGHLGLPGRVDSNYSMSLPWNDFHRHINVFNHRGFRKWGVRIVNTEKK